MLCSRTHSALNVKLLRTARDSNPVEGGTWGDILPGPDTYTLVQREALVVCDELGGIKSVSTIDDVSRNSFPESTYVNTGNPVVGGLFQHVLRPAVWSLHA
eukprot:6211343-Pleurochrysis_carterae.AAC.4